MRIKRHILPFFTIFALIALISAVNYFWLSINKQPPSADQADHLISALRYRHILGHPSGDMLDCFLRVDLLYPPLVPFVAAIISIVFGQANTILFCMTNVLYLSVIFFCLYFIGLKTGNKWSGVLAAYILMMYPMFFHLSRMFMLEVPLVCMVTLCIALLMYSRNFEKRGVCLLAGISFGLGLLTKQFFPLFIVGPAAFFFMKSFSGFNAQKKNRIVNLILFILVGSIIALPWYLTNFQKKYTGALIAISDHTRPVFSLRSFIHYPSIYSSILTDDQIMPFFAVSFVLALILLLVYKKTRRMRLFVIWIIVPYVIFFFIPASFYYYTLPYLTAVAVLTILGFWAIKSKFLRITCLVLLLILGAGQFIIFSFFFPSKACKVSHKEFYTPQMNDSPAAKMVDRIIEESRAKSITIGVWFIEGCEAQQKKISFGDDGILLSIPMLQYAFDLKGISRDIFDVRARERGGDGALPNFIILPFLLEKADFSAIQKNHYGLIDEFDLADQSKIYLYKFFDPSVEQANVNIHRYEADGGVYLSNFGAQISSPLIHLELKNNVWKIFWKGREITKRLSVYTSFRSSGHWIDSRQYVWFTRKVSDKHIRGIAFEPSVPLCQIWDFIIAGQRIYWNVKGIVPVSVNLEREQSNVMLSSEYAYWFDASSSGEFPKKFNQDFGGDWQVLKEIRPGAEYIGARSEDISLPKVTFHSLDPQKGLKGYIINSDDMFQGRVLQYVMKHQDNFFRWFSSYEYFSGYIDFEDAGQQIRR